MTQRRTAEGGSWVRRIRGRRPWRPDEAHAARFWFAFDLEIERARRHERTFGISRFRLPSDVDAVELCRLAREQVRAVDAVAVVDGHVVVLWTEADRDSAELAAARLAAATPVPDRIHVRTVVFPADGITRPALWRSLTTDSDHHGATGDLDRSTAPGPRGRTPTARTAGELTKRLFDLAIVVLTAPVTAPTIALCAVAVRLDSPGPTVFAQRRTGRHGEPFRMFKFRTMVRDAEAMKAELQHLNVLPPPDFKIPDDPRITRVGRFLRATSLDELPQLWNVVRGDMSIVGPRPTSFGADTYRLWHTRRLEARPGLTGLWQVSGRHTTGFDERVRLDETYIRQRSLVLDVRILANTAAALLRREGA